MILKTINHEFEVLLYLLRKEAHGRELAKELKTSLTRIQSILYNLRQHNVIDYKIEGKNHVYFIKKNIISKAYILNAENYKLVRLFKKHPLLEPLFRNITKQYPNLLIILFGSYAKFIAKEDSDIDIYICTNDKKIKDKIKLFYDKLSIKMGNFNKEDLLIQEIIRNHIIIQRGESYYEKLRFFD